MTASAVDPVWRPRRRNRTAPTLGVLLALAAYALSASPVQAKTVTDPCDDVSAWQVRSGTMTASGGLCRPSTGQFRATTRVRYGDASMDLRFRFDGWNTTNPFIAPTGTTGVPLRGVLVMARWHSADELYYIVMERSARYGQTLGVSKKLPIPGCVPASGVQCGTYYDLDRFPTIAPERLGWHTVRVEVVDLADGVSVRLRVWYDGTLAGEVVDDGTVGGRAIRGAGYFGVRSDNARWAIDSARWRTARV